jgi:response regulator of citrate/malate metabolism
MRPKKLKILIVDDNSYYTKRMMEMLIELDNVSVINTAENFEEAHILIDETEHDLILLDIQLPDGNGLDLLKIINQSSHKCEVIMVSNCSDEYYRKQSSKLGARYFLDKTRDFEMVPALLQG